MGMENTCCGCTLQRGTKIIAIFDIFLAFITLLIFLFFDKLSHFLDKYLSDLDPAYVAGRSENPKDADLYEQIVGEFQNDGAIALTPVLYLILALLWATCDIAISVLLIHGSNNRNRKSCTWWFRLRVCFLIGFIIYFFVCLTKSSLFLYGLMDVLKIFYRMYCLSSVDSFIRQLERDEGRFLLSQPVPHVQVVTPDGSYAELFPNRENFQDFYPIHPDNLSPRTVSRDHGNMYTRLN